MPVTSLASEVILLRQVISQDKCLQTQLGHGFQRGSNLVIEANKHAIDIRQLLSC